jgi:raffinose/stachyose/melibiose transport system permease protein
MLALILNKKIKGTKFFRTVIFMPVVLSTVIVSLVWNMVYNYQVGLLNRFLDFIGLGMFAQNWLGDPKLAMLSVSITIIWQYIGLYTVVFLAALQNVPEEIMEAAEIDGATGWKKTFYVTIPMIWDSIIVALIYCISGSLRSFDLIFLMTNGGPAHATEVMAIYMYNKAFSSFRYGYASAISIMILVMSLVLIFFVNKIMRRENA